jgi:fluoroacetyl-CoA thioesterase
LRPDPVTGGIVKQSLAPGIDHELRFVVPGSKTVPCLYPESPEFTAMPEVFATGFMVGLIEWACIRAIAPHLDEGELSLGVHVDLSHDAATPPGMEVVARVRLEAVEGRALTFSAEAVDAHERICAGTHRRFVVDRSRFEAGVARKAG